MANKANANIRATLKINNGDDTFWPKREKSSQQKGENSGKTRVGKRHKPKGRQLTDGQME